MHTVGVVALIVGAIIVLLVALLRVLRDLMLRGPYAGPRLDAQGQPRLEAPPGLETGSARVPGDYPPLAEQRTPMAGDVAHARDLQARESH